MKVSFSGRQDMALKGRRHGYITQTRNDVHLRFSTLHAYPLSVVHVDVTHISW